MMEDKPREGTSKCGKFQFGQYLNSLESEGSELGSEEGKQCQEE